MTEVVKLPKVNTPYIQSKTLLKVYTFKPELNLNVKFEFLALMKIVQISIWIVPNKDRFICFMILIIKKFYCIKLLLSNIILKVNMD